MVTDRSVMKAHKFKRQGRIHFSQQLIDMNSNERAESWLRKTHSKDILKLDHLLLEGAMQLQAYSPRSTDVEEHVSL